MSSNDFEFGQDPFSLRPEPKYFYQSSIGESLYRQLSKQIRKGRGVLLVTGEAGIGKTVLISEICRELGSRIRFVRLQTGNKDFPGLISQLFSELELETETKDSSSAIGLLRDYLSAPSQQNTRISLIFDDAHRLEDDVLTKLLSIAILPGENCGSLQIILSGLPELDTRVFRLELPAAIKDVKIFCCTLEKLSPSEVRGFIKHRLMSVGYHEYNLFTPDAISRIAGYSNGIPRLLIKLCSSALSKAYLEEKRTVTGELVDRVAEDYLLKPIATENEKQYAWPGGARLPGLINRLFSPVFARPVVWATGLVGVMVVGGLVYQMSSFKSGVNPPQLNVAMPQTPETEHPKVQSSPVAADPAAADEIPAPVAEVAALSDANPGQSAPPTGDSRQTVAVAFPPPAPSEPPPGLEPAHSAPEPAIAAQPGDKARQLIGALEDQTQATDLDTLYREADRLDQRGQSTDAYLLYFYAAKRGHGEAAFKLAQRADPATFKAGAGMLDTPNLAQANKWYQQALSAGHGQARDALSRLHAQVAQRATQGDEPARRLMLQLDAPQDAP